MARTGCKLARITIAETKTPACEKCPLDECTEGRDGTLSLEEMQRIINKKIEIIKQNSRYRMKLYRERKLRREEDER